MDLANEKARTAVAVTGPSFAAPTAVSRSNNGVECGFAQLRVKPAPAPFLFSGSL